MNKPFPYLCLLLVMNGFELTAAQVYYRMDAYAVEDPAPVRSAEPQTKTEPAVKTEIPVTPAPVPVRKPAAPRRMVRPVVTRSVPDEAPMPVPDPPVPGRSDLDLVERRSFELQFVSIKEKGDLDHNRQPLPAAAVYNEAVVAVPDENLEPEALEAEVNAVLQPAEIQPVTDPAVPAPSVSEPASATAPPAVAATDASRELSEVIVNDFKKQLHKEKQWTYVARVLKYGSGLIALIGCVFILRRPLKNFVSKVLNKSRRRRKRLELLKNDEPITEKTEPLAGTEDLLRWKRAGKPELSVAVGSISNNDKKDLSPESEYKGELGFHEIIEDKVKTFAQEHPGTPVAGQPGSVASQGNDDDVITEVVQLSKMGYNVAHIAKKTGLTPGEIDMILDIHQDRIQREKIKVAQAR